MMKTYAEKNWVEKFDWFVFLNKEEYTNYDLDEAVAKAGSWATCACGNQCAIIPRDSIGEPFDRRLRTLGFDFYQTVKEIKNHSMWDDDKDSLTVNRKRALKLLSKIEKRSAVLIRQQLKLNQDEK